MEISAKYCQQNKVLVKTYFNWNGLPASLKLSETKIKMALEN